MHRKFWVNPFSHLGDMDKASLLQEVVLNFEKNVCRIAGGGSEQQERIKGDI